MIQSSQVNQFGYSLTQAGGGGTVNQGLNQGDDSQPNASLAGGNPLSNSGGGGGLNNLAHPFRAPIISQNTLSQEQYAYNASILGQNQNSNIQHRNFNNFTQVIPNSVDAQQDDQNVIKNKINSQRAGFPVENHLNNYQSNKFNQGSYVTQNTTVAQQQQYIQTFAGAEHNQQTLKTSLSNIPGSQREILQTNSSLNLSNELDNGTKQKICSYSFIPNHDQQEKVLHIKGGIMVDEKVILSQNNSEEYLVHQNFSQYIDCKVVKKLQINCGEGVQPISIVEIPIKKKEGDTQFQDLVMQFKNGNASSQDIALRLEQYEQFIKRQEHFSNSNYSQQNLFINTKKEENLESTHLQSQNFGNMQLNSSQVKQEYGTNQKSNACPFNLSKQMSQNKTQFQGQNASIVGHNVCQKQNISYSNPAEILQQKEDNNNNSQSSIVKKNNQNQQQLQSQTKSEIGTELTRSNSGGNKSKQNQLQHTDGQLKQEQSDSSTTDQDLEKFQREQINNILVRHKSDYFSYVIVYKNPTESMQQQNSQNFIPGLNDNHQQKEDKMVIGHSTKFITLLYQDEDQLLASKMIREKKFCIFLTKLNRENYIEYLKNRIFSESNGVSQQFPFTCISSLDHVFKPTISYTTVKNSSKLSSQLDEKNLNPENHLNSSSSSSTIQQQLQQQQLQSNGLNQGQQREQQHASNKCPFINAFESKVEVKTYKQIDVITLDNLLFKVDIDVIEEQTPSFKIIIFKYIITDSHIQELVQNRVSSINQQTSSLNQSGGGTPFQRKSGKRPSLKQQQSFNEAVKNNRDKSISMGDEKQRSLTLINNASSSLKSIPLAASSTQDIFNPKNMQYETNSEKFITKFYSQHLTKNISETNQNNSKVSGESSSRNKSSKIINNKEANTFNQQLQVVQQETEQQNQSEFDEEYLERQFKLNNPTYDNNNNIINQAENLIDYHHNNPQYPNQNSIQEYPQYGQNNIFAKQEQNLQPEVQQNHFKFQIVQNQGQQPAQFQIQTPLPNASAQNQKQSTSSSSQSQILKIEIPKLNQSQDQINQSDKNIESEANIFKLVRPNPSNNSQSIVASSEDQNKNERGKKKQQPRTSKKKQNEDTDDQQTTPPAAAAKTKRIKKDQSTTEENKKESPEQINPEKKQNKRSKKQKEQSDKQEKKDSENPKIELEQSKKLNDIVSLKNIPMSQEQLQQQNSSQLDSQKILSNPPSQPIIQQAYQNQQQHSQQQLLQKQAIQNPYNQQAQVQIPNGYNSNPQNSQMNQQQHSSIQQAQQQKGPLNYHLNQQQQNQMYQQYQQQNMQQQNQNNLQMYYNQNGQQIPQQQIQSGQYLNINGQLYQQGYLQSPHLNYSPQLTTQSPYQQSQKIPNYSPSPNFMAQNASQSAPCLPPLDLNQTNTMYQQYKQFQNYSAQQNQPKQQNPFSIPQAKSQPVLGSMPAPNPLSQETNPIQPSTIQEQQKQEIPNIQIDNQAQMQEEHTDGKQKKGKKRETKQKKQTTTKSPSKIIQEGESNDEQEEEDLKKSQAPQKQKRISKKKENENQPSQQVNEKEEKPQKKQYQRKPKANQQKSQEEEAKEQSTQPNINNNSIVNNTNNNNNNNLNQNNQDINSQVLQDQTIQNQQNFKEMDQNQPSKIQTSIIPNHPNHDSSYQQQQHPIYYQHPSYYPYPHGHDNFYDSEFYHPNYPYTQYQNPEIQHQNTQQQQQQQQQHQQQGNTQNQQYHYMNNDYFNQQNYNYYYQQNEIQPQINSQHSQQNEINHVSNQQNQVEQVQNEEKNTKKPKASQAKQKPASSKGTTKNSNNQPKNEQK